MIPRLIKYIIVSTVLFLPQISGEEINIVFTHENPVFGELLKEYNNHHKHKVVTTWIDQSDLKSRLVELQNFADVPDILIMPSDGLGMDEFVQFSEIPHEVVSPSISDEAIETTTIEGRVLGIPIVKGNHLLLYYNKSLIDAPANNWQELTDQREDLPDDISVIRWSFMEMYWFIPFLTAFGDGPVIDDQPDLDTDSMQQALAFIWDLANSGLVEQSCNYECADTGFINGKSAYVINGIWAYQNYKNILGDDLGIAQLPRIGDREMKPFFSTIIAAFPRDKLTGPKQEALLSVLDYIQSEAVQRRLWDSIRAIPADEDVMAMIIDDSDAELKQLLGTMQNTLPMSSHRNMAVIWEVILKGYLRYGSGIWNAARTSSYMQELALKHIADD